MQLHTEDARMTAIAPVSDLHKNGTGIELIDTSGHSGKNACSPRLSTALACPEIGVKWS
jgi:hypothetical protein